LFTQRYAVSLLIATSLFAADPIPTWPQFRGPNSSGIAAAADPPVEFGPGRKLLWKTPLPHGHSSPSIWGDRIFLSAFEKTSRKLEVLAVDRNSGKILWRREAPANEIETVHEVSSPATATPVLDGERVIVYFGSYGLVAFDFNGKDEWSIPLGTAKAPYGSGSSPVLAGDSLILSRDEGREPYLLAIDRRTGKTVWKQKLYPDGVNARGFHASSPALWRDEIIVHLRNEVAGFSLKTGARKWWMKANTQGTGSPLAGPDAIYVGTWFNTGEPDLRPDIPTFDTLLKNHDKNGDGVLTQDEFPAVIAFSQRIEMAGIRGASMSAGGPQIFQFADKNRDGKIDRAEWTAVLQAIAAPGEEHGLYAIRPGGEGQIKSDRVLWKEPRGVPEVPMPLLYEGRVYTVTNGGIISVMEAQTGKLVYRGRLGAGGPYYASPIAAAGRIYFTSGAGVITVLRDAEKLEVLARNDLEEPIFATPAVIGNTIYVRTATQLLAFRN
jgi:outer membrane protein assembly factor BamB